MGKLQKQAEKLAASAMRQKTQSSTEPTPTLNDWCQHHTRVISNNKAVGLALLRCSHCGVKRLVTYQDQKEYELLLDACEVSRKTTRLEHRAMEFNRLKPWGESIYWTGRSHQRKFGEGRRVTGVKLHGNPDRETPLQMPKHEFKVKPYSY